MNTPGKYKRLAQWLGMALAGLALNQPAHAQVTPLWTNSHSPVWFEGTYFDNIDFTGPAVRQLDARIAFDWGARSPLPSMGPDAFSVRWKGVIQPDFTEDYTFYAVTDDGFRLWLNDQLIIDSWIEQAPTEHASEPIRLQAGGRYEIKVEYYENTGTAVAMLLWSSASQAKAVIQARGDYDTFGATLTALNSGRFAVGAPYANLHLGPERDSPGAGAFWYGDLAGTIQAPRSEPLIWPWERKRHANALSAFPDGSLLVGSPGTTREVMGTPFSTNYLNVGHVYLYDASGALTRAWPNPTGTPVRSNEYFGLKIAALPGNRFAASSFAPSGLNSRGKVFIFDASQEGAPVAVITNLAPTVDTFGSALAPLGTNRLLIGDSGSHFLNTPSANVTICDFSGNRVRTIQDPGARTFEDFGATIVAVDAHRFLVGAPGADVPYLEGGQLTTNSGAGKVYLFDDGGTLLKTFLPPDPARSYQFGAALAMLGPDRVLIGAPGDQIGDVGAGAVHLFDLDALHLASVPNPTPEWSDSFGFAIAALDDRHFVVGAPYDDTLRPDAGSIYAFDAPVPQLELGTEIPRPTGLDVSGTFPMQGPGVTPAGAAFWHAASQKLFAVRPGPVLVTWPLLNNQKFRWEGSFLWPTNREKYQIHVAGPASVDLSDGGAFSQAVLCASSTDAATNAVEQARLFRATVQGNSLILLSSGNPADSPIRFQLVRTIAANDPAYLHDNAPATVGEPIVDPAGYHDPLCGGPAIAVPGAVYCPAPVYDPTTRQGTIIPVNRDNPATPQDDLIVAYYQRGTRLSDPVSGAAVPNTICWPYQPVRFKPEWPANAPHLVIASQQGTGLIDPAKYVDWDLYFQNDASQPGFNPNDEHALRRTFGSGEGVFALRDDLGTPQTSEPFVLIRFRDPAAGNQWRMKVWKVVAEEAPFVFRYPARAGQLIQAPMPLSTLAPSSATAGVSGPFWRDRKLSFWAKAAGDDGGIAEIVMRYYYPMQAEFYVPGGDPPPIGANVPLLDLRAGTPGTPINIRFDSTWPEAAPELRVGETLVKAKNGLPQLAGQSSVEVLYEQSVPLKSGNSVRLIDPARVRSVPLAQLPTDLTTRVRAGKLTFPTLPPHLETRLSYDPVLHQLQLQGQLIEPPAGESYILLNVLTARDASVLASLSTAPTWQTAVTALANVAARPVPVPADSTGFDALALTTGDSQGTGYVTLAFGNSTNLSAPAEPISLNVIKVTCPPYRGELKVIPSPNPLAEQLTLRHSGDFGGRADDFEFEWRVLPPADGLPSTLPPEQWGRFQPTPATGMGALDITISGPGLYTLSDNYFVCRYRRVTGAKPCGADWSAWTPPMLAEGWIKRVLAGIGPFEQRIQDYQETQVNTIVSMISQAGARARGDVALNLDAANQTGLIELYETVLRRGMNLSIDGATPVDYAPANDALLLAAGRLADLYMLLGNEAYADAADPTIAFGTTDGTYGAQATSIHCFMNQTASLLEEELGLLRGRDASKLPSVQTYPVYNRLIWNFTRDISGGEVAYALNYNIRNADGDVAGTISEADAQRLYPQGHGDAWGHYLTAIKNYYRLLRNPHFTWVPRTEAVIVGGVPVSVDYLDERKFATAAAARARTGAEIVNLTFRRGYTETPPKPWQTQNDPNPNRAWGLTDWSSRAGQGAFFDWVMANALLPDVDTNPSHTGIQKIERAGVRELPEISEAFRQIQEQIDQADQGRNPLGLANNVVPFDIDPGAIAAGKTHFEQVADRANEALKNAITVFDHANASTQLLRRQADEANAFHERVLDSEADFNNRLIEIFGTPYTDDIGPNGTYPSPYEGPDIYHYDYVDSPEIRVGASAQQPVLRFRLSEPNVSPDGRLSQTTNLVTFHLSPNGFGLEKPASWTGQRRAPGEVQMARSAFVEALRRMERGVVEYEKLVDGIVDAAASLQAEFRLNATQLQLRQDQVNRIEHLDESMDGLRKDALLIRTEAEAARIASDFFIDAMPKVVGLASDVFSVQGATLRLAGRVVQASALKLAEYKELTAATKQDEKNHVAALTDLSLFIEQTGFNQQERLRQLEQLVRGEPSARLELAALKESLDQSFGRYESAVARGLRLLQERTRFRQQTAAQIQTYRYKDMAFRIFRSDALQKYRAQFDLAARYAYLAAKAYDYETCLAPGDSRGPGSAFLGAIIASRSLGLIGADGPLQGNGSGDPGLADSLARMKANWNIVLKGQLGFNNPQIETGRFSLRNELFRVLTGPAGSERWRETLEKSVVPNVLAMPEFQRHCIPFSPMQPVEPAIVIPFATTINFGLNFFGWPAGGGDNDYDSTKFATKVRSVGVWFANYNNLGGGMINTPRVYLIPVGLDVMRAPTQGDAHIREWRILDQALPVPFPLRAGELDNRSWTPMQDTLNEDFAAIRRFGRFRAFHDSGSFNAAETINDSRLVGRSVWNTRWLLIIPAGTLHTDRAEGIQRFIHGALRQDGTRDGNGVSDIKVFFQTYAYSGN